MGEPISVRVIGDNYPQVQACAIEIESLLKAIPGTKDVGTNFNAGKEEVMIRVDPEKAAQYGVDTRTIALTVRTAIAGMEATTIKRSGDKIAVIVKYQESLQTELDTLDRIRVPNQRGKLVYLNKIARFENTRATGAIAHEDGKRVIKVRGDVSPEAITPVEANQQLKKRIEENKISKKYPTVILEYGGEFETTKELVDDLGKAFGLAVLLIYVILAAQFRSFVQPFIVIATIPFGILGVLGALAAHGYALSFIALMGTVALSGVVVNDSLILIDFINTSRAEGKKRFESIIAATRMRLRPVLLTSITTIVGLMPLAYGIGGDEPFLRPMAVAIAYGLLAGTFLTLVITPCFYSLIDDLKCFLSGLFHWQSLEARDGIACERDDI